MGPLEEATAAYEAALEAERISCVWPKDPEPHVHLIQIYVSMGKFAEAVVEAVETIPRGHERKAAIIAMHAPTNTVGI